MIGRGFFCLLAFALLIPSASLLAQSGQADAVPGQEARDFVFPHSFSDLRAIEPKNVPARWAHTRTAKFGFRELARAAGTIFCGTVTSIARRPATASQAIETVAITFHVERAIRGAIPNGEVTIQQWIGVWSGGQRYRVGERVLLFLYPPSKLGLTSSVGGPLGRFSIDIRGRVLFSAQHLSAFHADPIVGGRSHVALGEFAAAVQSAAGREEEP